MGALGAFLAVTLTTRSCAWPGAASAHSGVTIKLASPGSPGYCFPLALALPVAIVNVADPFHTPTPPSEVIANFPGVLPAHVWSSSDAPSADNHALDSGNVFISTTHILPPTAVLTG